LPTVHPARFIANMGALLLFLKPAAFCANEPPPFALVQLHAVKARVSRFTDRNSRFLQVGSRLCRRTIPVYGPTGILSETPVPQRQNDHTANAITGKEIKFPVFPSNDGKICGRPVRCHCIVSHGVGLRDGQGATTSRSGFGGLRGG
jgi:hypothetical protein